MQRVLARAARTPLIATRRALARHPAATAQFRDFSMLRNVATNRMLQNLKDEMNKPAHESNALQYITALSKERPKEVMEIIEKGWMSSKLPFSEAMVREYIKTVATLGKIDSINITGLLELLSANPTAGRAADAALVQQQLGSMIGGAAARSSVGSGSSPANPLYIARPQQSFRDHLWKFARTGALMMLGFTLVAVLFEDKIGSATGGRLGGSNFVRQAENPDKSFDDVVGVDEAKAELQEIVMYLKDPKRFTRLGGRLPKGVLLTGPPGTGKTLLARAIAGEANVPFFHASGAEFEEMYVGVGAKRVRELFEAAKAKSPCIIFIDEIDAIGGSRNVKDQSALKMTLNQLLVEMDGFAQNNGIIVIAATNFPDSLDSALVRPGRFDKHVDVTIPDIGGRKSILELYAKKVPMDEDVDMDQLSRGTPGFSGAELFNMINQAALKASVEGLKAVNMAALEFAKDKIMMGAERRSAVISPETMRMTAFHEAGHALVALKTAGAHPVHKATIMPRGRALGMVMQLPEGDQTSMSRAQMLARLDVCMGGRVAEELVYGKDSVTSGASNDIMQATRLARAMVTKYGLSDKVGVVFYDEKSTCSAAAQGDIDQEVKNLLQSSYERAKACLSKHRADLDLIAKALIEFESVSGADIVEIMEGKSIDAAKRTQRASKSMGVVSAPKGAAPKSPAPVAKPLPPALLKQAAESPAAPIARPASPVTKPAAPAQIPAQAPAKPAVAAPAKPSSAPPAAAPVHAVATQTAKPTAATAQAPTANSPAPSPMAVPAASSEAKVRGPPKA